MDGYGKTFCNHPITETDTETDTDSRRFRNQLLASFSLSVNKP